MHEVNLFLLPSHEVTSVLFESFESGLRFIAHSPDNIIERLLRVKWVLVENDRHLGDLGSCLLVYVLVVLAFVLPPASLHVEH